MPSPAGPADAERTRIASCAVAVLMARARTAAAPGGRQPATRRAGG